MEYELTKKEIIDCLRGLADKFEKELEEEEKEKSKPKHESIYWGDLTIPKCDSDKKLYINSKLLNDYDVIVGDRLLIGEDKYVVVNIVTYNGEKYDSNDEKFHPHQYTRYYLMPCYNLDSIPMHPDDCQYEWEKFGDTWMYKECITEFFNNKIRPYFDGDVSITLASKEEIFGEYKFSYFKEGREKCLREFIRYSYFWLRSIGSSVGSSACFAYASSSGDCGYSVASNSYGFRPLIIVG